MSKLKLRIDNREVEVPHGATILDAARQLGIVVPTLCFLEGHPPAASCMVCVVKVRGRERLAPACATFAADGMEIETGTDEVIAARKAAFELLLSEHLGDCEAPCRGACPAHMNIPLMIRQIAAGRLRDAIATVKRHIALPATLGRICSEICEKGCRRALKDGPLSIRLLKRFVADADLASADPYVPERRARTHRKVAIVGAGPAGLAAAFHLLHAGHECVIFDDHEKSGGMLRYAVPHDRLPPDVLDAEIRIIARLGAEFRMGTRIGRAADLLSTHDAVLVAAGKLEPGAVDALGLPASAHGLKADKVTLQTDTPGVFVAGDAFAPTQQAVRSVAAGRAAAVSIHQFLSGAAVCGEAKALSVHMGRPDDADMEKLMAGASGAARVQPQGGADSGLSADEARREAMRCMRCDCRKAHDCKLRAFAQACGARVARHKGERRRLEIDARHADVVYEAGKCIVCGICTRIAEQAGEPLGLAFVGRGFDVRVAAPFNQTIADALQKAAQDCVKACPTGALAFKDQQ